MCGTYIFILYNLSDFKKMANSNHLWGLYLTGREHTPMSVIKHQEHFDFVPRKNEDDVSESMDVDEDEKMSKKRRSPTPSEHTSQMRCPQDAKRAVQNRWESLLSTINLYDNMMRKHHQSTSRTLCW